MENKKVLLLICVVLLVLVAAFAVMTFSLRKDASPLPPDENNQQGNQDNGPKTEGIVVAFPRPNDVITSPVRISGRVNGNGWTGFEGQVGIVKLFDSEGKELALGILTATGEWMQPSVNFETQLFFEYPGEGTGKLVFYNENASGEPERNKTFTLPVKLQKSSAAKTEVKVYFTNNESVAESCENVVSVKRELPKTEAPSRAALEELLKGPTDSERHAGLITSINPGVTIKDLTIENKVARVDFSEELDKNVSGSCKVTSIRTQITRTLTQFSSVESVVISVNGKTDDILQP